MKIASLFSLLFVGLAMAAPLEQRQSTRWNDPYIKKPSGEGAVSLGGCAYQITFRRDGVDSRHTIRFYADYASAARRELAPTSGDLPISSTGIADYGRYTVPNGYVVSTHHIANACSSSGAKPTSFRVRSTLGDGYTYRNDYISPAFTATSPRLPAAPSNVRITRTNSTDSTITWDASADATSGYWVLVGINVYASELGSTVPGARTIQATPGQTSAFVRTGRRDSIAKAAVLSRTNTNAPDVFSDASKVPTIYA